MERADLAITGGGSTTWERCVLGLPGLVTVQSEDQLAIAEAVARAGGQRVLGWSRELVPNDYARAIRTLDREELARMSSSCASLCDGLGAERVADQLINWE
jgi:spore coat polysaccharide biosynthesis predicted glycosyltransferase SpsG